MKRTLAAKVQWSATSEQMTLLEATVSAYPQGCNPVPGVFYESHHLQPATLSNGTDRRSRTKFGLRSQIALNFPS